MLKSKLVDMMKDAAGVKFSDRSLVAHLDNAFNTVAGQIYVREPSQLDYFARKFIVDIVHDPFRFYSLYPCEVVMGIDTAKAVRHVYPTGNDRIDFVPIEETGVDIFSAVDLDMIDSSVGYIPKSDRCEYWNLQKHICKVVQYIVVPFSEWSDTDDIPLPMGVADQIIQLALSTFRGQAAETNIYKKTKNGTIN